MAFRASPARQRAGLGGLFAAGVFLSLASPALGQVGATIGAATDYRLRGLSLTDFSPALTFSLTYDQSSGAYLGGTAVTTVSRRDTRLVGASAYAGITRPLGGEFSLDVGGDINGYTLDYERRYALHYAEAYLGLIRRNLSVHVYFKPDNPQRGINSAYADVNWTLRPSRVWRLSAHAGANTRLNGSSAYYGRRDRVDTQLAVARAFGGSELETSWTASAPGRIPHAAQTRPGLAVAYRYFF